MCGLSLVSAENLAAKDPKSTIAKLTGRVYVAYEVLVATKDLLTLITFVLLRLSH